jgi:TolB-like protein/DNA-binding SARP family transcriptional activator/Flp pilus assembly protein TadD
MTFSLKLLGGPGLEGDGGAVGGRAIRGHRLALLSLLAAGAGQPITRDKLIALLWPDSDTERSRHLLSHSLYLLRQSLGEDGILAAGDGVRLNPERVRSDVQAFEDARVRGDHEGAARLYGGPFLDGFFLADAPEFERWAEAERTRLARGYAQAVEALAEASEARADLAAAVHWWRTLAAHDPYSGRVTLRLMQALETAGDRAAAVQQARVHQILLREEIGAEPDPRIAALEERLRAGAAPRATPAVPAEAEAPAVPADGEPPAGETPPAAAPPPGTAGPAGRDPPAAAVPSGAPASAPGVLPRASRRWAALAAGILVLLVGAYAVRWQSGGEAPLPSLAVLPFADLSGDPANAYFVDGIHEDILTSLSRISSLRVISRTSVLAYRPTEKTLRQVARELGVSHVLEGSVRRDGERVLITAQLIDARTDHHLWAEQYHRDLTDIFVVQAEIAQRIGEALRVTLTPAEQRRVGTAPTGVLTAYDLYLQAMQYAHRYRMEDLEIAIGLMKRAIAADPDFSLAHARLAASYALKADLHRQGAEWTDSALAVAQRALALDPDLAEAHHALGTTHTARGEHRQARRSLERAIELNPSFSASMTNLAAVHARSGAYDEAVRWLRRSVQVNPRAQMTRSSLAWAYAILGLFPQAEEEMEWSLVLQPDPPAAVRQQRVLLAVLQDDHARAAEESERFLSAHAEDPRAWATAGGARFLAGDTGPAREYLERAVALSPTAGWLAPARVQLGHLYLTGGEPARGRALLRAHLASAEGELPDERASGNLRYGLAAAHAGLGERREANRWLRALVEDGAGIHRLRLQDPLLASLHGDPEFERIRSLANARLDAMRRRVERQR